MQRALIEGISTVLLDIEGTVCPIAFVKDTLFPYVTANVRPFLVDNWNSNEFKSLLNDLVDQSKRDNVEFPEEVDVIPNDSDSDKDIVVDALVNNILWQVAKDRKTSALKTLQGRMWKSAYVSGDIKAPVYLDVVNALYRWKDSHVSVSIYSSGSVEAQRLLFSYSESGDLTPFLSEYFDTRIGMKRESNSYSAISDSMVVQPARVLFLTDVYEEARAAESAGMSVCLVVRPGNNTLPSDSENLPVIKSFDELFD